MKKKKNKKYLFIIILTVIILSIIGYYGVKLIPADNSVILSEIPDKPNDFDLIVREVSSSRLTNLCDLPEEYWKQPEFYPTWNDAKGKYYDAHDFTRWGVHGYGAFPARMGINVINLKAGEKIEVCTFLKSGYNIETYQGARLEPIEDEYFNIEIEPQLYSEYPNHFLLYPTFPKISEEWVTKVKLKITAKENIPVGNYSLGFDIKSPDDRFSEDIIWNIVMNGKGDYDELYYLKECSKNYEIDYCEKLLKGREKMYVSGGGFKPQGNTYSFVVNVEE